MKIKFSFCVVDENNNEVESEKFPAIKDKILILDWPLNVKIEAKDIKDIQFFVKLDENFIPNEEDWDENVFIEEHRKKEMYPTTEPRIVWSYRLYRELSLRSRQSLNQEK